MILEDNIRIDYFAEFDFLFEQIDLGLIMTDENLNIIKFNANFRKLFNFSEKYLKVGDNLSIFFGNYIISLLNEFLESDKINIQLKNFPLKLENDTHIVQMSLYKKNGLLWIFIGKDKILYDLNSKFDELGICYAIINNKQEIINSNTVTQKYFGSTNTAKCFNIISCHDVGFCAKGCQLLLKDSAHLEFEREINTQFGPRYFKIISNSSRFDDPELNYISIILIDMTSFKTMLAELQNKNNMILENMRHKNEFIANITHELKTPLTTIIGYIELIHKKYSNNEIPVDTGMQDFMDKSLSIILKSSNRLHDLINNLLKFSEIEQNKVKIVIAHVDFKRILDDIRAEISGLLLEKKLNITFTVSDSIQNIHFYSDVSKIKIILSNLIVNAVKFTNYGFVSVNIEFENDDFINIRVKDSGIGIPQKFQTLIFEPFRQVDGSTTRKFSGAGLGLSLVKKYVEFMGGNISVESEEKKGTEMIIRLKNMKKA